MSANAIASQALKNGHLPDADKSFARMTSRELSLLFRADSADANLSGDLTASELAMAINKLKAAKSQSCNNILPKFMIYTRVEEHQPGCIPSSHCAFIGVSSQRSGDVPPLLLFRSPTSLLNMQSPTDPFRSSVCLSRS